MTDPGLLLDIGGDRRRLPGALLVGSAGDADVPLESGDEFPFEDCAADAIVVRTSDAALSEHEALRLLVECRRVLRPRGLLRFAAADGRTPARRVSNGTSASAVGATRLRELASLAGLVSVGATDAIIDGARDAAAAMCADARHAPALELTKPDRSVTGSPLVSILIPAYGIRYFAACLASATAQTYANIEIVVCDDSPDAAIETVVREGARGRTLRYERNETRLRPRGNFIRCFERARGEFVKFLCDDDLLDAECVDRLLDAYRSAPDITLATSHRRRIDAHGRVLADQPATRPVVAGNSVIVGHTLANAMLMAGLNTIGEPSTTLFRKSDFSDAAAGYFHFDGAPGRGVIDMVMWASLLLKGNAVYLRQSLSSFRNHPLQRQRDPLMVQRTIDSIRRLQAAWLAFGLHERHPPDQLLVRPFPPGGSDWQATPVQGFAARRLTPA
jgi:glycosyltransferase involved in cell wall biosynthesis